MTSLSNAIIFAAVFLSYGLLATAKEVQYAGGSSGGLRRKRNFKQMNNVEDKMDTGKNTITIEEEDALSNIRLLGKEAAMGSMPLQRERPPSSSEDVMAHSLDDTGMINIIITATP
eukprot:CAMPEP_0201883720 /NCGR_PEP_ID=MMETSP0902-20130614/16198_1 /ASSEMBLY_ACC=CAM_ASM_000551 /TAXON_ID=420261 /ORGANISM="Thalassiosira antarctica, Strain CCMP982" /LENGTH=115 /DNA_ID=CAMNT_0048412571 /DNA_START=49 /DNA_END=396 /DNA_ORIENTATION=-